MGVVTKKGDKGSTGLFAGRRVAKDSPRINAIGSVDELNCAIGVLAVNCRQPVKKDLYVVQENCFTIGAELATLSGISQEADDYIPRIKKEDVEFLEEKIAAMEARLPKQTKFILPGGNEISAQAFWVRSIARRAERAVVSLKNKKEDVSGLVLQYLNRVSDYFFILGRFLNHLGGEKEIKWAGGRR